MAAQYRLRGSLTCFIPDVEGEPETISIPAGSIVTLKSAPAEGFGLALIQWEDRTALTLIGHFLATSEMIDTP